jgi:very-short-patch-repair endonuclease
MTMTAAQILEKERKRALREKLEKTFLLQLRVAGLHGFVQEHEFHPTRKWRIDFARPEIKLAIEVEGGTHTGGRHTRGAGYESDCEKYNALEAMGWTLFRFTSQMVTSGKAILFVEDYLKARVA